MGVVEEWTIKGHHLYQSRGFDHTNLFKCALGMGSRLNGIEFWCLLEGLESL